MQLLANQQLLTTAEAAEYLRIKERKLYELVAEGQVPCTKATGKWLFPRGDLDRWLLAGMARPLGVVPAEPPPIVGGSHDPLLQWTLAESRAGLAILPEGSERGYQRFLAGEVMAAAIHFHDVEQPERDMNVVVASRESGLYDAVLIGFAKRDQGLLVAKGNPLGIEDVTTAARRGARFATRPPGAGAQQLLEGLLRSASLKPADIDVALVAPTGPDIAQAIRAGHADLGVATRSVATAADVGFVPLLTEHFDILVRQRDSYRPPMQSFLSLLRTDLFAQRAAELGGLDVTGSGLVRWAP